MMKKKLLFLFIIFVAIVLRFYQLGSVPPSPDWDEVALGYDAHSIFTTGRDEYGTFLPIVLRSFDDYKPALYAYLAIPFVELFGPTSFAVRLPSAIMGVIAVVAVYFLVKELFGYAFATTVKKGNRSKSLEKYTVPKRLIDPTWIALLAAFSLAISPWHIQFSRIAFETNVGVTFNILMALFFVKGLKRPWLLLASTVFAGLNLSVYQSERVFTPLLFLALVIIFRKELFAIQKKYLFSAIICGIIAIMPLALFIITDQNALLRVKGTSIFNSQTEILKQTSIRLQQDKESNDIIGQIFDNRRVVYATSIASAYLSHYDLNWLFITGDINRHHAPGMGLLYIALLPFVFIGIYQLVFGPFNKKTKCLIFAWFLLAPVPASITTGVPHAVRTMNFLPTYDVFIALGAITFVFYVMRLKSTFLMFPLKYSVLSICAFIFSFNFVYYLNQYFVQQNYSYAYDWQYGYEQTVPAAEQMRKDYEKVIVSDRDPMDKSYMFFLFYLNYSPQEYQKIGKTSSGGFLSTHHFETYEFRGFNWKEEMNNKNYLFIGTPQDFPPNIVSRKVISYPNGKPSMLIVDPKDNQ